MIVSFISCHTSKKSTEIKLNKCIKNTISEQLPLF